MNPTNPEAANSAPRCVACRHHRSRQFNYGSQSAENAPANLQIYMVPRVKARFGRLIPRSPNKIGSAFPVRHNRASPITDHRPGRRRNSHFDAYVHAQNCDFARQSMMVGALRNRHERKANHRDPEARLDSEQLIQRNARAAGWGNLVFETRKRERMFHFEQLIARLLVSQ